MRVLECLSLAVLVRWTLYMDPLCVAVVGPAYLFIESLGSVLVKVSRTLMRGGTGICLLSYTFPLRRICTGAS